MKMILADENIPRSLVDALRREGFDVVWVCETTYRGSTDEEIIALANKLGASIITRDKGFIAQEWKAAAISTRLVLIRDIINAANSEAMARLIGEALEGSGQKYLVIEKGSVSSVNREKSRVP